VKDPYQKVASVHTFALEWRWGMGFVFQGRGINSFKPISVPKETNFAKNDLENFFKMLTFIP
jgi:hypothetical protein